MNVTSISTTSNTCNRMKTHNLFVSQKPADYCKAEALLTELYPDLKRLAFSHLAHEHRGHTLTPTAMVHETYLSLYQMKQLKWIDKPRFMMLCSQQMRRILIDYARAANAQKRGGDNVKATFYEENLSDEQQGIDMETMHQALAKLGEINPELETLVELRYFSGFSNEEVSQYFAISLATVKRKWTFAKAWLHKEMVME